MKAMGLNPYLPYWENVPDGEPHVFGERIYIFGSHDRAGGSAFCVEDYACWSAPTDDLGNWRYEGIIYGKMQDPINGAPYSGEIPPYDNAFAGQGPHLLYAPDVARGPDGRYYLYYSLDFTNIISVAVCDTPAGKYEFLAYVTRPDGSRPNVGRWFDPAILSEESGNYLYYGFCPPARFPGMEELEIPGGMAVRLADDMHTIVSEPVCTARGCDTAEGTDYAEHPFFEASSIRHYGEWYYLVYSSLQGHELCYGMSENPEGPFSYRGVLHSNGDIGYRGNRKATNYMGNNHGGLVKIGEEYYIFGHRHTHGTSFSRQGVAERIEMQEDGAFLQAEQTSCGLNGGPLPAKRLYPSYIACHLTERDREKVGKVVMTGPEGGELILPETMPYITEEECGETEKGIRPYVCNMQAGAVCGFKYLEFAGDEQSIMLQVRGKGKMEACLDLPEGDSIGETEFSSEGWAWSRIAIHGICGVHGLYFRVAEGKCDFTAFEVRGTAAGSGL